MKKRKKRHGKKLNTSKPTPDVIHNIQFLKPDEEFLFECSRCGECCRNVEYSVMLEPYDLFRIARHLQSTGCIKDGIEDVIMEYADVKTLEKADYPVFLLKTHGPGKECVFLKESRCSIYEARPRACRTYPMGVWPDETLWDFDCFIASEKQHHFRGPSIRAADWMDRHFSSYDRAVTLQDAKALVELAPLLRHLWNQGPNRPRVLELMIMFRYVLYELDQPFMPQYERNMKWLLQNLNSIIK